MPHLHIAPLLYKHGPSSEPTTWLERLALVGLILASAAATFWFLVTCVALIQ